MAGYKVAYTLEEDKKIIKYIIDNDGFNSLRGKVFWEKLEKANILDRTWQSLKEHFRKQIIHKLYLPKYELEPDMIKKLYNSYNYPDGEPPKKHKPRARASEEDKKKRGIEWSEWDDMASSSD